MAKLKPVLKFEKWRDPYGEDIKREEWPGAVAEPGDADARKGYVDKYEKRDALILGEEESPLEKESRIINAPQPIKFIHTNMGHIPLTEHTRPGKIFNFWVGHANFNISYGVAQVIEKVDGVELLDIHTRYRFRIGIGKQFTDRDVMADVIQQVYKYLKEKEKVQKTASDRIEFLKASICANPKNTA